MERPHQRPRFVFVLGAPPDAVAEDLRTALAGAGAPCTGGVAGHHARVFMRDDVRHFWSPTLELRMTALGARTQVEGRFGPHPDVWTMFLAVYAALGILGLIGGVFGLVQLSLGQAPWGLAAAVAAIALVGFVYGAAFIGRGLGSDQMIEVRLFLDHVWGPPDEGAALSGPDLDPVRVAASDAG